VVLLRPCLGAPRLAEDAWRATGPGAIRHPLGIP